MLNDAEIEVQTLLGKDTYSVKELQKHLRKALQLDMIIGLSQGIISGLLAQKKIKDSDVKDLMDSLNWLISMPPHEHKLNELDLQGHNFLTKEEFNAIHFLSGNEVSVEIDKALKPINASLKTLASKDYTSEVQIKIKDLFNRFNGVAYQKDIVSLQNELETIRNDALKLISNLPKQEKFDAKEFEKKILEKIEEKLSVQVKYEDKEGRYYRVFKVFGVGKDGLVPRPTQAEATAQKVLAADGTWITQSSGGGTPGGSSGDIQYNNAGAFGGYTTIPLANGGAGQSMAMTTITTSGTINNLAVATGFIYLTNASGLTGIVSDGTAKQIVIYCNNPMTFQHQSTSSTAANRLILPNAESYVVPAKCSVTFIYDTTQSRWILSDTALKFDAPLSFNSTTGHLSIALASASQTGALTSTDYNNFNSKPNGSGTSNALTYWNGTGAIAPVSHSKYSSAKESIAFGQTSTNDAKLDIQQDYYVVVGSLTSFTASLTPFSLPTDPNSFTASFSNPNLAVPTQNAAPGGFTNAGSGAYFADGSTYEYYVEPMAGGIAGKGSYYINIGTDPNDGNYYDIDLGSWVIGTSIQTVDNYRVWRSINGAGFNDYIDIGTATAFTDTNSGWTSGAFPTTPQFPDFVATGLTHDYSLVAYRDTLVSTRVYSNSPQTTNYTDPNDGTTYLVFLNWGDAVVRDGYKIVKNNTYSEETASSSFTDDADKFTGGTPAVTPTSYGYVSDGSTLNRNYHAYSKQTSPNTLYTGTYLSSNTTDPNDFANYVIQLSYTGAVDAAKILRDINSGGFNTSLTVSGTSGAAYDDNGTSTSFTADVTVTPTAIYDPIWKGKTHDEPVVSQYQYQCLDSGGEIKHEWLASSGTSICKMTVGDDGMNIDKMLYITFVSTASSNVPNNSVFRNSATGKLSYKDNSGTVNALY